MAQEAPKLGLKAIVQTPSPDDPAVPLAAETVFAPVADARATAELARRSDAITFENEFVDLAALQRLERDGVLFRPRLGALAPLLDKYEQHCYLHELGLPVPKFQRLDPEMAAAEGGLAAALQDWRFPLVVKARRHGYDGQGTAVARSLEELQAIWRRWGQPSVMLEAFVPFDRELAIIAARNCQGQLAVYPVVETQQEAQVCRRVIAPAPVSAAVVEQCEAIARSLLDSLDVVGLFAIELFLTKDETVLINEIAPRTHNSGHFSLDVCETSQFSQILRAVCDLPLGSTAMTAPGAVMVNLLGYEHAVRDYVEVRDRLKSIDKSHVYWYEKTEARPGRKLGHVTVELEAPERAQAVAQAVEEIWYPRADAG